MSDVISYEEWLRRNPAAQMLKAQAEAYKKKIAKLERENERLKKALEIQIQKGRDGKDYF